MNSKLLGFLRFFGRGGVSGQYTNNIIYVYCLAEAKSCTTAFLFFSQGCRLKCQFSSFKMQFPDKIFNTIFLPRCFALTSQCQASTYDQYLRIGDQVIIWNVSKFKVIPNEATPRKLGRFIKKKQYSLFIREYSRTVPCHYLETNWEVCNCILVVCLNTYNIFGWCHLMDGK